MAWQPIETAPRDGSEVLAIEPDMYGPGMPHYEIIRWLDGKWVDRIYADRGYPLWQPLPDPPSATIPVYKDTDDGAGR